MQYTKQRGFDNLSKEQIYDKAQASEKPQKTGYASSLSKGLYNKHHLTHSINFETNPKAHFHDLNKPRSKSKILQSLSTILKQQASSIATSRQRQQANQSQELDIKYVLFPTEKSEYNDIFDTKKDKLNKLTKSKVGLPNSMSSRGEILKDSQKVPIFANQYPKKRDDKIESNPLMSDPELTNPIFALGSQQDVQALFSKILVKKENAQKKNKRY